MDELLIMVFGFVIGCTAIVIIWALTALIRTRIRNRRNEKRDEVIALVERKWVDVDSVLSAYRAGRLTAAKLRESLAEKLETINMAYKPCIHQLDIFFIKYTEKLIDEYTRIIEIGSVEGSAGELQAGAVPEERLAGENPATREMAAVAEREAETGLRAAIEAEAAPVGQLEDASAPAVESGGAAGDEEPVIAAMTEAAKGEEELPIETFLEMGTGAGAVDESVALESKDEEQKEAPIEPPVPVREAASEPATEEQTSEQYKEQPFAPALPAEGEMTQTSMEYPDETIEERPFAFAGRAGSAPVSEMPLPPPPPPGRIPEYAGDENVQPATIYDVEAETIIADRSEIMKSSRPVGQEQGKSNLGITGDDVSETLDKFFGFPKR